MSELIISVAGLRGVVGETLTPEAAMRYAAAFSASAPAGTFIITRDSRPSGAFLADAVHAALNALGRNTVDGGIAATPTTGILVRQEHAAGGIQISASHNPSEYNGMKLFTAEGRVIPKFSGMKVLEQYNAGLAQTNWGAWADYSRIGQRSVCSDPFSAHLDTVLKTVDVPKIAAKKFNVLLDSNHGAGAVLGAKLLERLNCCITILGEEPSGQFLHTPEPTPDNLTGVCGQVKKHNVDIAFCQDPDADRLAVIDGSGRYIGEEYTAALCMDNVLQTAAKSRRGRNPGPVVVNCATSRMCEDIARKYGAECFRSAVGEANVVDLMQEKSAVFGGEGNGGPIDPMVGFVRDSFVGMAQILDLMAASGKTIAELADALPKYSLVKRKMTVKLAEVPAILDRVAAAFKDFPIDCKDGLRIERDNGWVLLRGSNTEAIIRIFAEAPTEEQSNHLCDEIEKLI